MLRCLLLVVLAILVTNSPTTLADIVYLKNGGFVEGRVSRQDNSNRVTIEFPGGSMTLVDSDIQKIVSQPTPQDIFAGQLRDAIDRNDADRCLEIAQWAQAKSLDQEYVLAIRAALLINPRHQQANKLHRVYQWFWRELPLNESATQRLLDDTGEDFYILRSPHYRITYNGADIFADITADRLESIYRVFLDFFQQRKFLPAPLTDRLEVILFDTRDQFRRSTHEIAPEMESSSGFFSTKTQRSYFYDRLNDDEYHHAWEQAEQVRRQMDTYRLQVLNNRDHRVRYLVPDKKGEQITLNRQQMLNELDKQQTQLQQQTEYLRDQYRRMNVKITVHEAVHQLAYACGIHSRYFQNPKWLVEGLALFFEGSYNDEQFNPNQIHGDWLNRFYENQSSANPISLDQLITDDDLFHLDNGRADHAYASAWALFYYLTRYRHEPFFDYIFDLSLRISSQPYSAIDRRHDFEKHFGAIQSFERDWLRYMNSLRP